MGCLIINKFIEIEGLLGTLLIKLLNYNYTHTVADGITYILMKVRRAKRVFISYVERCRRNLKWGRYRPLDMFGMGLKYEWWFNNLKMTIGYTHHIIVEAEGGYILILEDKRLAIFSGHIVYLNLIFEYIKGVNPLGKYKEKGIIDPILPPMLRKRKEKRR